MPHQFAHLAIKPGENIKTVKQVTRTEKCFFSTRQKKRIRVWLIYFNDGYMGELFLEEFSNCDIEAGSTIKFRVGFRNDFGDEIELLNTETAIEQEKQKGAIAAATMSGHPAIIALTVAKDIAIGNQGYSGETISYENLTGLADQLYNWLTEKRDNK